MPNLVLVHLAFEVPKNLNEISWKILLIRYALNLLKPNMIIEIKKWLSHEF